jgi:tetratricopeptide (TPR) repeat protein
VSVLYASENLLVRAVPTPDEGRWVVTFDHYRNDGGLERSGFGEDFLQTSGISAIHFLCRGNDWYQYEDIQAACAAARRRISAASWVVTYGSSMGAYAALRFADAVGAHAVLALAPQYSVDPSKVPWELRWLQHGATIRWRPEVDGLIRCMAKTYVVFDPTGDDLRHVLRIEEDVVVHRIAIPHGGHPVTTYLADTNLIQPLLLSVLAGEDAIEFMRSARNARKKSSFYLAELARAQPQQRPRAAMVLARKAVGIAETPLALLSLADAYVRMGWHHEAFSIFERIVEQTGRDASYIYPYAEACLAAGDLRAALALAEEMVATCPGIAHLLNWLGQMLWDAGRREEAISKLRQATEIDPQPDYMRRLEAFIALSSPPRVMPEKTSSIRQSMLGNLRKCLRKLTSVRFSAL